MGASSRWLRGLPDKLSLGFDKLLRFLELYIILHYVTYRLLLAWSLPFRQESLFIWGLLGNSALLGWFSFPGFLQETLSLRIKSSYFQFQFRVSTLPKISVLSDSHIVLPCFSSQHSHNCALKTPNPARPLPRLLKAADLFSSSVWCWLCARDGQSDHHISKLVEIITFHLAKFTTSTYRYVLKLPSGFQTFCYKCFKMT